MTKKLALFGLIYISLFLSLNTFAFFPPPQSPAWYNASWLYREAISIPRERVLDSSAVLKIDISQNSFILSHSRSDCFDVLFSKSDGTTKLNHGWEFTCGIAYIEKAALTLPSSGNPVIYVYFDNPSSADQSNRSGVWDSNTQFAWEFRGGSLVDDISGNTFTIAQGVIQNIIAGPGPNNGPSVAQGVSSPFAGATVPYLNGKTYLSAPVTLNSSWTIEIWTRPYSWGPSSTVNSSSKIFSIGTNGSAYGTAWEWDTNGRDIWFSGANNSVPVAPNYSRTPFYFAYPKADVYNYIMVTSDGTTGKVSWNGILVETVPVVSLYSNGNLYLGANYSGTTVGSCATGICFQGEIAEVRISNIVRTPAYAGTQYENIRYPNLFYSFGVPEQNTTVTPVINSFTSESMIISGDTVKLSWFVSGATFISIDNGIGSQSALVSGEVSISPSVTTTYTLTASNGAGTSTQTFTITPTTATGGIFLHIGGPSTNAACGFTTFPTTVYVCGSQEPGYKIGDLISVWSMCSSDGPGNSYIVNFGPRLRISGMADAGTLQVTNHDGTTITPNGTFLPASSPGNCNTQNEFIGTVVMVPTPQGIYSGNWDGLQGPHTRQLGTSTDNGLTSLICTSGSPGTCTVITTYANGMTTGNYVAIYGTTDSCTLGGLRSCLNFDTNTSPIYNDHQITVIDNFTYTFQANNTGGTFTTNNSCSPFPNCVIITSNAIQHNQSWTDSVSRQAFWGTNSGTGYLCTLDGGATSNPCGNYGLGQGEEWIDIEAQFGPGQIWYAERSSTVLKNGLIYCLTHLDRMNINGFTTTENPFAGHAGNPETNYLDGIYGAIQNILIGYIALTGSQQQTFRDKLLGDIQSYGGMTAASKTRALLHPEDVDTVHGLASCGTCDTTHITFDSAVGSTDYTGWVVYAYDLSSGNYTNERMAYINSYVISTKIATLTFPAGGPYGGFSVVANSNTHYRLIPSVICTASCPTTGATGNGGTVISVTGTGTHFTGFSAGASSPYLAADAIYVPYTFPGSYYFFSGYSMQFQSATDDTHASFMVNDSTYISSTYPTPMFWSLGWRSGDVGVRWLNEHNGFSGHSSTYPAQPPIDAAGQNFPENDRPNNNNPIHYGNEMAIDFPLCTYDIRACIQAEFDNFIDLWHNGAYFSLLGGISSDPWHYTIQDQIDAGNYAIFVSNSIPSYPSMDTAGGWTRGQLTFMLWGERADNPKNSSVSGKCIWSISVWDARCTNDGGANNTRNYSALPYLRFNPSSTLAQAYKNWITTWVPGSAGVYGIQNLDIRIPSGDYTQLTLQQFMVQTSKPTVQSLTGWNSWPGVTGYAALSFGSTCGTSTCAGSNRWTDTGATNVSLTAPNATHNAYAMPGGSSLGIGATGGLIGSDQPVDGPGILGTEDGSGPTKGDSSRASDTISINGFYVDGNPDYIYTNLDRWATAGNSDPYAGDPNSNYMYVRASERGAYGGQPPDIALRDVWHYKAPGFEQIVIDHRVLSVSNSANTPITDHVFYQQTGESADYNNGRYYNEGPVPTCPSSTCTTGTTFSFSGNVSTPLIVNTQSGAIADSLGPARNHTVISAFIAPSAAGDPTINISYRGHAWTDTVNGNGSYSVSAYGHADRVDLCSGTCNANAITYETVKVHKITTQPDVTLNVTCLVCNSTTWIVGQTTDVVFALNRNGVDQTSLTFTSTVTARVGVSGLQPGTYTVDGGGSYTVNPNDNSLYLSSLTAGTHNVVQTSSSAHAISILGGNAISAGKVIR